MQGRGSVVYRVWEFACCGAALRVFACRSAVRRRYWLVVLQDLSCQQSASLIADMSGIDIQTTTVQ